MGRVMTSHSPRHLSLPLPSRQRVGVGVPLRFTWVGTGREGTCVLGVVNSTKPFFIVFWGCSLPNLMSYKCRRVPPCGPPPHRRHDLLRCPATLSGRGTPEDRDLKGRGEHSTTSRARQGGVSTRVSFLREKDTKREIGS